MTSVRKSVKAAKRELKELVRQGREMPKDGGLMVMARVLANDRKIAAVPSVSSIRLRARIKAFTRRCERKVKKQGKWAEYREFVAYQKRMQASLVLPTFEDTPTMSYEWYRKGLGSIRRTTTHNNVQIISEYDDTRGF